MNICSAQKWEGAQTHLCPPLLEVGGARAPLPPSTTPLTGATISERNTNVICNGNGNAYSEMTHTK